jgi:peptidyl-prolyl cis-trans isomerase D
LTKEHASAAAKTKADELIASLRDGKTPLDKAVEGRTGKSPRRPLALRKGLTQPCCRRCSVCRSRRRDKPTFSSVTLQDGSLMIVRLNGVNEAATPTEEEKAQYRRFLASREGQQDFRGLPQAAGKSGGHQAFLMPD